MSSPSSRRSGSPGGRCAPPLRGTRRRSASSGLIVGIPVGLVIGAVVWHAVAHGFGTATATATSALAVLVLVPGALVVVNLAALLPGWVAGRADPAVALRSE